MQDILINILEQGLIFGMLSIGVYITYKILDFPDLSVDGTFVLGGAVSAAALLKGLNPYLSLLLALLSGIVAGGVTGFLNVKLKITNILSGILVMIGLYSISLRIMGKANIALFSKDNIFEGSNSKVIIILVMAIVVKLSMDLFLKTKSGFLLIGAGDNPQMVTSLGVDVGMIKIWGLMISNGIVAFSGGLMAQYQKFSDISMGTGTIIIGLASIILGESLFKNVKILKNTSVIVLGAILYKSTISIALALGLPPTDLKLITALIVVIALSFNKNAIKINIRNLFKRGGEDLAKVNEYN